MAASSSSLSLPLQHATTTSSGRLGHGALCRPSSSPSVVRLQPTRGGLKKSVAAAAASYHDEASAAGHGDDGIATGVLLRQKVDDAAVAAELRAARSMKGRAPPAPPKGRPGKPVEGSGGKVHATPASVAKRVLRRGPAPPGGLPAEGSGGQGGSIH